MEEEHQQAIEEKDAAIALLNDDLEVRDNQIQAIKYEDVALQAQRCVSGQATKIPRYYHPS